MSTSRRMLGRDAASIPDLFDWTGSPEQERKFAEHDAENPHVWTAFCRIVQEAIDAGMTHWSADAALHVVRFETAVRDRAGDYKANNSWTSYYARKWLREHPERRHFFRLRRSRADKEMGMEEAA